MSSAFGCRQPIGRYDRRPERSFWVPPLARLTTLILLAVVLAASCASEGPPRGATSVFLTIRGPSSSFVPDELRLSARTQEATVFEGQRLPEAGQLVPIGGSLLGTVTLYVGDAAGWLQIEVAGLVDGAPRWSGVAGVQLVADHQVTAEITLDVESAPGDASTDGDPDGGTADSMGADGGETPDAGADVASDVAGPGSDATADRVESDGDPRDTAADAHDGGGTVPDVVGMDAPAVDRMVDSAGGDGGGADGGSTDASTPAPFLRLKFDETSGTTASDSSGNKRDGTLAGAVTHLTAGRVGGAVHLDGAAATYVELPDNLLDAVRDVTIALWVRLTTSTNRTKVFDFGSGTNGGSSAARTMYLAGQWSGPMRFAITNTGSGGEQALMGTAALAVGVWTHVTVVLGPSGGTLYVNGAAVDSSAAVTLRPVDLATTPNVWLGRSQVTSTPNLDGDLDDFRIYDRALTAAEVAAVYGATQ